MISGDSIRVVQPLFPVEGEGSIPISPLQLQIEIIDVPLAAQLNRLWHSRVPVIPPSNVYRCTHKICFGANHKNIWYAVAIWSSPVARKLNGQNILELRRLAISPEAPKNTASRMISVMVKMIKKNLPEVWKLISYQDPQVHTGTIYMASGWQRGYQPLASSNTGWGNRIRNKMQAPTPLKIRWEKQIRPEPLRNEVVKTCSAVMQMELFQ
jgi:hypothetical protein